MYYVWKRYSELAGKYAYFTTEPEGYDVAEWTSGEKMRHNPPPTVIRSDEGKPTKLTDLLLTRFNMQIFSPKLVKILEDMGIKNIDYYPVKIINHETGEANETYKAAQIIGKISCLDVEHSECDYFSGTNKLMDVTEFRLHEDRIKPTKEIQGDPLLFRLGGFQFIILAHESVKNRLEQESIVGVKFIRTEDYVG